ncbi:MAG: hypothetical protein C0616_03895 [Desulfuromonas sp.]|nr:MAG: hypothetical protein C0616_03895 [Desulfuromonas sp.]
MTAWCGTGLALDYGDAAPGFSLDGPDGKTVSLSDFKGKVVILKLATTWCPTCKQQSAEIEALVPFLNENQVTVIDVFLQDTQEMVDEYLAEKTVPENYISLLDDGPARTAYNVYLIPRLLIIDREQKVRRDGSLLEKESLKTLLEAALGPKEG